MTYSVSIRLSYYGFVECKLNLNLNFMLRYDMHKDQENVLCSRTNSTHTRVNKMQYMRNFINVILTKAVQKPLSEWMS
jgi:hypothetical protein